MPHTYDQPYNFGAANGGISIDVFNGASLLTNFTSHASGTGAVSLTVSDTTASTLYFVRNSDSVRLATVVFDPREVPALATLGDARIANLDAAITSRLAAINYTAPANADLTTLLSRVSASRAALLDNLSQLDAAVSSRLATAGYTAPSAAPTAAAIRAEIDSNSTKLDVAVSTRLAGASYTAPDNAGVTAIKAKTDQLTFTSGNVNANAEVDLTGIEVPAPDLGTIEEDLAIIAARFDAVEPGPAAVIPAATDPAQTVAYGTTRNAGGTAQGNIAVEIELVSTPASGFYAKTLTPKSDSTGQLTVTLQRLASYKMRRGAGSWKSFTTTDTDTYELPVLIEGV